MAYCLRCGSFDPYHVCERDPPTAAETAAWYAGLSYETRRYVDAHMRDSAVSVRASVLEDIAATLAEWWRTAPREAGVTAEHATILRLQIRVHEMLEEARRAAG